MLLARLPADCFGAMLAYLSFTDVALARSGSRLFSSETLRRFRLPSHWNSVSSWRDAPVADARLLWGAFRLYRRRGRFSCVPNPARHEQFGCDTIIGAACVVGWPDKIQWVCETLGGTIDAVHAPYYLESACVEGQIATAQWLVANAMPPGYDRRAVCGAVYYACTNGHLDTARRLVAHFSVTSWTPRLSWMTPIDMFRRTCQDGHLSTAQWLVGQFAPEFRDRLIGVDALRSAAQTGQLPTAQWLTAQYEIEVADVRETADLPSVLYCTCGTGNLEFAQWLTTRFGLTRDDVFSECNSPLHTACAEGHLRVVQWLIEFFELTVADMGEIGIYNSALWYARNKGHRELIEWLEHRFGTTVE